MAKIGMVSLGCPKNQVDAEIMLKKLIESGYEITPVESEAEAIIVNTCGFIEDAKAEAIENILEVAKYKQEGSLKALIVTGCLAERYRNEIKESIPEVDSVVSLAGNNDIVTVVNESLAGLKKDYYGKKEDLIIEGERLLTTPKYMAYIKVAEGCDNCCSYCAIPKIRGRFRSRSMESVLAEARKLAAGGVKELVVVAQDTTRYGEDLCGKSMLPQLLTELCKIEGIEWIRTLYTYPERITDELIEVIKNEEKVVNYLDIPIQHCNDEVLKRMNRKSDRRSLEKLIAKLRSQVPDITIRTTLITGFPGETEQQFEELCEFVKEIEFDKLGCFAYSEEEGTVAAGYDNQVEQQVRVDRSETVMNDQSGIVLKKNAAKVGTVERVIIEGYDDYIKCYFGRTAADAPEIDGKVFFISEKPLVIGAFCNVRINDSLEYDLLGELEE